MRIREYAPEDEAALRALHAAQSQTFGMDYEFPDLRDPLFVTKLVLHDCAPLHQNCHSERSADFIGAQSRTAAPPRAFGAESPSSALRSAEPARIVGAALLRLTAEAYLLVDPRAGTPRRRWESILALHDAAAQDAWRKGLADVHAWLPPRLAKRFGRRLESLGWVRDDLWTPYCKKLTGND
jgi:hypothetical protein